MSDKTKKTQNKTTGYMRLHRMLSGIVRFFLRVRVVGKENIPTEHGMVVCANHISYTDPVAIAAVFPRQMIFLAKAELFKVPVFRSLIRALGAYPLNRRGDVSSLKNAIHMAEGGMPVLIFPQGTRRQKQNPAATPVKSGAGMVAMHAGVPLVPVCIKTKNMKYRLFRRIDIIIGAPIYPAELGLVDLKSENFSVATNAVFSSICHLGGFSSSDITDSQKQDEQQGKQRESC